MFLARIRTQERKIVLGTFAALFGILAGHTLVETARDAMFLAKLPATDLPLTYLAIAFISLFASQFAGRRSRRALGRWLLASALVTAVLWWVAQSGDVWVLYAIYVWSGVFISIALVQYWILLGQVFSLEQAKRLYGPIGAGSVLGAIVGALAATGMSQVLEPRHLLLAGSLCFAASGLVPLLLLKDLQPASPSSVAATPLALHYAIRRVFGDPYVGRLAALVAISTVAFTLVDYLFKAEVAARVAPEALAETFGVIYVVLNATALAAQLFLTGWLLRVLGVQRVLWILPGLLLGGALFMIAGGAMAAAVALKGADGTFKHSLHRTASEVLFLPISDRLRPNAKRFIDMVGRRAAQALASVVILGVIYAGGGERVLALLLAVACLAWIMVARRLKPHYLGIVRDNLRRGRMSGDLVVRKFDLSALEALMGALNSADDAEVKTAMELMATAERAHLIPGLILHHPSRAIVTRALELFAESHRLDHLPIVERLTNHADPQIRAAVLRTHPDLVRVALALDDRSPLVQATALVSLVASGGNDAQDARQALDALVDQGGPRDYIGLAEAIAADPDKQFAPLLLRVSSHPSTQVRIAATQAMALIPDVSFIPTLIAQLAHRDGRVQTREALRNIGDVALDALGNTLSERTQDFVIRRHVPRAIGEFGGESAAHWLMSNLHDEPSGMIRYRILRSLERMRSHDRALSLDEALLDQALTRTLGAGYTLLDWRVNLEATTPQSQASNGRLGGDGASQRTVGQALMIQLIADKEEHAIERLLRLLNLWHRDEDFEQIFRGLRSKDAVVAGASLELLANLVRAPHTEAVIGLVSGLAGSTPDAERLASAGGRFRQPQRSYEQLVMEILAAPSDSLRALAAYHVGELGWVHAVEELEGMLKAVAPDSFAGHAIGRALERLKQGPQDRITTRQRALPRG